MNIKRRYFKCRSYSRAFSYSDAGHKAEGFIKCAFFDLDDEKFGKVASTYLNLYGEGSYRYLLNTYLKWKSGNVKPSRQTQTRILQCVPKHLSLHDQFKILEFYIPEAFYLYLHDDNISFDSYNGIPSDDYFKKIIDKINKQDLVKLNWFVKGVYTSKELDEFKMSLRYFLIRKTLLSYHSVSKDIIYLSDFMNQIDKKYFCKCEYTLKLTGDKFIIKRPINNYSFNIKSASVQLPCIESKFKPLIEEMIVNHELSMAVNYHMKNNVLTLSKSDLSKYIRKFKDTKENILSIKINIMLNGGACYLSLRRIEYIKIIFHVMLLIIEMAIIIPAIIYLFSIGNGAVVLFAFVIWISITYSTCEQIVLLIKGE